MRLIDADANREQFKKVVCETLNDDIITTKKKFELIMTAFDSMPTAYDVDAVVAELEKRSNEVISNIFAYEEDDHIGIYNNGLADGYEYAIGIVRNGGVE